MKLPMRDDITDLVWLTTGFLGDLILNTAAFEVVSQMLPWVRQHVITTPLGIKALAGARSIVSMTPFEKRGQSTWRALRETKKTLQGNLPHGAKPVLLQVHRSFRSSLLARWIGMPTVTYMESSSVGQSVFRVPRVAPLHEAQRIALLLEPLGIPRLLLLQAKPHLEPLPLLEETPWQAQLKSWVHEKTPIIAIAPGSVWGTKRWTKDGFVELIKQILLKTNKKVLLLGSQAEKELSEGILAAVGSHNQRVVNLSGVTSLDDLRRIYPVLSALVCNDSSPLHYGSAFDVPTVSLFGATIPEMGFGPLASRSRALGVTLDCRPCSDHGPEVCPKGHFRCMGELSSGRVFYELENLIKEG